MTTTVSTKGQIVLPAEIRRRDGIQAGEEFEVERIDYGETGSCVADLEQTKAWLTGCWIVPRRGSLFPVASESTDTL